MSRINPESEPAESSLPYGLRLWTGKRAKCCSSRFLAYLISPLLTVRKNSKCEFISGTHRLTTSPFSLRFSLSAAHSLNDLQGQRNKLLVLDLAICIHVCLPPTALGKVQFRIGSNCYKPTKCMDMHESGKIIESSSQFPIFLQCPEDSTNLKPLADNQFHWFHVDYKCI